MKNFNKAVAFAAEKHEEQKRKGTQWPYIVHIYEVVQLLKQYAEIREDEMFVAATLHDVVEDCGVSLTQISDEFGSKVAEYVWFLSENKELSYAERKKQQAAKIAQAPNAVKLIKCADCLSNLRSTYLDIVVGENDWSKFNGSKKDIEIKYYTMIMAMQELEGNEIYRQLKSCYNKVFGNTFRKKVPVKDCTECKHMKREADPDSYDWFCDDDEKYVCTLSKQVLSSGNRPYEKQPVPSDCPLAKVQVLPNSQLTH